MKIEKVYNLFINQSNKSVSRTVRSPTLIFYVHTQVGQCVLLSAKNPVGRAWFLRKQWGANTPRGRTRPGLPYTYTKFQPDPIPTLMRNSLQRLIFDQYR